MIFERDDHTCQHCGRRYGMLECDHIKPIDHGGAWFDPENLRTLCRRCSIGMTRQQNRTKSRRSAVRNEFLEMANGGL